MTESLREQLLTLKVMRLTRPTFYKNPTVVIDEYDLFGDEINSSLKRLTGQSSSCDPIAGALVLPQSFNNIYLGETFTFYVCVHNDSKQIASQVSVKADMQTSTQRVVLACKLQNESVELAPEQIIGEVISHEIKEVGQHIMVCTVTYSTPTGEKMSFRKFFKFPVDKPLDVRTKFYNAENDDVYLEAQIQNTSNLAMVLERISLDPSDLYTCTELNPTKNSDVEYDFLKPQDTRQFLYCLQTKPTEHGREMHRGVTSIGKLDMIWRSSMGEKGRLQTSQLQRMMPGYGDLRLTVETAPSCVPLGQPFQIVCRLRNCSERELDLTLTLDSNLLSAFEWIGDFSRHLGQFPADSHQDVTLELRPKINGLKSIDGVRVVDALLNRTYEIDDIATVFVI